MQRWISLAWLSRCFRLTPVLEYRSRTNPRRTRQQAKQAILIGLITFFAVQLGISLLMQLRPKYRDPLYGDKLHRLIRHMASAPPSSLQIIALGSSRTSMGLDTETLSDRLSAKLQRPMVAFNFAFYGVGPVMQAIYLDRLLADGIRPDWVLIEFHPSMFAPRNGTPIEVCSISADQLTYDEIKHLQRIGYLSSDAKETWWESRLVPSYGSRYPLLGRILPNWLPGALRFDMGRHTRESGWGPIPHRQPTPEMIDHAMQVLSDEYREHVRDLKFDPIPLLELERMIQTCQQHQIEPILIVTPEGNTFRSWYSDQSMIRLRATLADLAQRYSLAMIDAHDWFDDAAFIDSHHLLINSATKYAERLADELSLMPHSKTIRDTLDSDK